MTRPTKSSYYDVVILGAGPAGAATALSLRQHAPFLSIALIDRSKSSEFGKGETLPPTVRSTLERLGIWEAFLKEDHLPAYGACSSWGSDQLIENEFIFNPAARGWHLDRARHRRTGLSASRELHGWRLAMPRALLIRSLHKAS